MGNANSEILNPRIKINIRNYGMVEYTFAEGGECKLTLGCHEALHGEGC